MKLEVGMYVRTKYGYIAKITKINPSSIYFDAQIFYASNYCAAHNKILRKENIEKIEKANHDIMKVLELGDVLLLFDEEYGLKYKAEIMFDGNGLVVTNYEHDDLLNLEYELISNEHITLLGIETRERFESTVYKVV